MTPTKTTTLRWLTAGLWPVGLFAAALGLGLFLGSAPDPETPAAADAHEEESDQLWTCSMHPSVELPAFGPCPICFMDLIPKVDRAPGSLSVADAEVARLGLESRPVRRLAVTRDLSLVGRLAFDETRRTTISAWVPGRIDRLFVDSTGITVREGDHLAELYSPPLYQAQVELAQATSALERAVARDADASLVDAQRAKVDAVRERLRLWGLSDQQLAELGEPRDHVTIFAPTTGVVVSRDVHEGHYVQTGAALYQLADTSVLWAELEAFESDLAWLHLGQPVTLETDALPGRTFEGEVSFVEPWLDRRSRTARLRVEVPNPRGELRPEMLIRARVHARVGADGRARGPALEGRFACPMHPGERGDGPGECGLCGMPLEPLAELAASFASAAGDAATGDPLVIPASAPLVTGRRAVVYVETPGEDGGRDYALREIELGPRAGDLRVVLAGLDEGELVVTRGAFKLDSELELGGSVSWMSSGVWEAEEPPAARSFDSPGEAFDVAAAELWRAYLDLAAGLAGDEPVGLTGAATAAAGALEGLQRGATFEDPAAAEVFAAVALDLDARLERLAASADIATWRERFEPFTHAMDELATTFGAAFASPVYRVHCPMAFDDRGADWLSDVPEVWNPYFGSMMLRCGEVTGTLVAPDAGEEPAVEADPHAGHGSMEPEAPSTPDAPEPAAEGASLDEALAPREAFVEAALALTEELVGDRHFGAVSALDGLGTSLEALVGASPDEDLSALVAAVAAMELAPNLEQLRLAFDPFSQALIAWTRAHAGQLAGPLRVAHCPMAANAADDDTGAAWLQRPERVWNPYWGDAMLHCGNIQETLVAAPADEDPR